MSFLLRSETDVNTPRAITFAFDFAEPELYLIGAMRSKSE